MNWSLFVSLFLVLVLGVYSDIPVHCQPHQIPGLWQFTIANISVHQQPSNKLREVLQCNEQQFDKAQKKKMILRLELPNIVKLIISKKHLEGTPIGTWTMIYDQGFEVKVGGLVFFAFSKYTSIPPTEKQGEQVKSDCGKTSLGWYSDESGDKNFGCFRAKRIFGRPAKTTLAVSPATEKYMQLNPKFNSEKIQKNDKGKRMSNLVDFINKSTAKGCWHARAYDDPKIKAAKKRTFPRKIQKETRDFMDQQKKLADSEFGHGSPFGKFAHMNLPESWDWRNISGKNFVSPVRQQGSCGSCYIFAQISSMESRLRIQMEKDPELKKRLQPYVDEEGFPALSQQDVVSCSLYSQHCMGGFPYLVGKYAHDYHVVPASCFPYTSGEKGEVPSCDLKCKNPPFRVRAKSYDYVGGFYGGSTAQRMQVEIMKNGPIAVNILTLPDFFLYEKGVYYHLPGIAQSSHWKRSWEPVTHSVVVVGWGVDKETGMKYWIVENSWGKNWGLNGFFLVRRDVDEISIESETSSVIPEVIFSEIHD